MLEGIPDGLLRDVEPSEVECNGTKCAASRRVSASICSMTASAVCHEYRLAFFKVAGCLKISDQCNRNRSHRDWRSGRRGLLGCATQHLEICDQIDCLLRGMVGIAVEEPFVTWHHRIGNGVAWIVKMHELPVIWSLACFPSEVWADAARSPHLGILILRLPCFGWLSKAPRIGRSETDLL